MKEGDLPSVIRNYSIHYSMPDITFFPIIKKHLSHALVSFRCLQTSCLKFFDNQIEILEIKVVFRSKVKF